MWAGKFAPAAAHVGPEPIWVVAKLTTWWCRQNRRRNLGHNRSIRIIGVSWGDYSTTNRCERLSVWVCLEYTNINAATKWFSPEATRTASNTTNRQGKPGRGAQRNVPVVSTIIYRMPFITAISSTRNWFVEETGRGTTSDNKLNLSVEVIETSGHWELSGVEHGR